MAVDDAKRGRLVMQIAENPHQHDVLDDVGKAAGMKGVTVVHGQACTLRVGIEQSSETCPGRGAAFFTVLRRAGTVSKHWLRPTAPALQRTASQGLRAALRPGHETTPPHRRHHYLIAAAGAAVDFLAGAELQILAHADPHFAQAPLIADHRDRGIAQARIGLDECGLDLSGRDRPGADNCRKSAGIFIAARALRMVSK